MSHGISNRICDGPIRCMYIYIYDILDIHVYIYIMICSIQKWRMRESLKDISYNVYNDV